MTGSVATLEVGKLLLAVFMRRALTWSGVRPGCLCKSTATAPLTIGAAMLVPLSLKYAAPTLLLPYKFSSKLTPLVLTEMTRLPGATMSGLTI